MLGRAIVSRCVSCAPRKSKEGAPNPDTEVHHECLGHLEILQGSMEKLRSIHISLIQHWHLPVHYVPSLRTDHPILMSSLCFFG